MNIKSRQAELYRIFIGLPFRKPSSDKHGMMTTNGDNQTAFSNATILSNRPVEVEMPTIIVAQRT
jgi:hypothetical protein